MILLTGAAGAVGRALLRRLVDGDEPVRCLVRDPRRLGAERVRVQIALGDLADPGAHRNAMRGVRLVVHLAASMRDQPGATIEEINAVATLRLVRAAERAGVERFVYCSCLGASEHSTSRLMRAKALAERVVEQAAVPSVVVAPSMIYAPENRWLRFLDRASAVLPAVPLDRRGPGTLRSRSSPTTWPRASQPSWPADPPPGGSRAELAGPDVLTFAEVLELAMAGRGRRRPVLAVPRPVAVALLRAAEGLLGVGTPVTEDEAALVGVSMLAREGTSHAEALGVRPLAMAEVLGPA
ncbi:MAG: NAD(P)H-binding protein [Thermoleophilaceae bacterium]